MGEVSELTGLAPHVLRNWERTYPQLKPKKNSAGNRAYKEEEVELIFKIKSLIDNEKYTSEGVKKVLVKESGFATSVASPMGADIRKDLTEMKVFLNQLLERL